MKSLDKFKKEVLEEGVVDTSDFKLSASGRKVRAHRVKLGDKENMYDMDDLELEKDGKKEVKESLSFDNDPPFVLVLRRKAIRMYPNQMKVAVYYNDKLNKFFSVPYGAGMNPSTIQAEEIEQTVMESLRQIVENNQQNNVKLNNGETVEVDYSTALAITQVYSSLNEDNKLRLEKMIHENSQQFHKVAVFAFKHAK